MSRASSRTTVPKNLGQLFKITAQKFPNKPAFFSKEDGKYLSQTWAQAWQKVDVLASFFARQSLSVGDRLAILSENRPEWAITDLAAQTLGIATVPIYPSLTASEIQYILEDSGAKMLVVSNKALFDKIPAIQKTLPQLKSILGFDAFLKVHADEVSVPVYLYSEVEKMTRDPDIAEMNDRVTPDALASIIYTSGTTGQPKGVMLTHDNFIQNALMCKETLKMSQSDSHLSFLPLCHVFERTAGLYLMIYIGASIAYAENMDTVPQNILEVRPTFLLGVPRFFEKVESRVSEKIKHAGRRRFALFQWASGLRRKKRRGEKWSFLDRLLSPLAGLLVYRKFEKGLGGRLRFCVSGGAPLAKEIAEFFYDLGVLIYEGYGLTETSPVMTVNRQNRVRFGSVGLPLSGVQIKISEDGEILTKSACVMKGYWKKPLETAEVLKEGWFYTGDLGRLDADGFLYITGRKKELIVTSGGKKISPRPIEELLEKDPFILRCVLYGECKKFITALLVPKEEEITKYARERKIAFTDYADLLKDKNIHEFMDGRIQEIMKDLASYEKIKYFLLLPDDFTQSSGELTPTLKVKREVVLARYRTALDALYANE